MIGGSISYLPALLALLAVGLWLWIREAMRPGLWLIAVAGIFAVSLTARTLDLPLCADWPGGHALALAHAQQRGAGNADRHAGPARAPETTLMTCGTPSRRGADPARRGAAMKARVHVTLKPGVLDPQGQAIAHALGTLGFRGHQRRPPGQGDRDRPGRDRPRRRRDRGRRHVRKAAGQHDHRELSRRDHVTGLGPAPSGTRRIAA